MSLPVVRASVRQVVETTYHDSDLSPAAGAQKRMREGAAAHQSRQKEGARHSARTMKPIRWFCMFPVGRTGCLPARTG